MTCQGAVSVVYTTSAAVLVTRGSIRPGPM